MKHPSDRGIQQPEPVAANRHEKVDPALADLLGIVGQEVTEGDTIQPIVVGQGQAQGDPAQVERETGARGRNDPQFDPGHLWRVYVQCQARPALILQSGIPGVPKSRKTLDNYIRKHGFRERYEQEIARVKPEEIKSVAQATSKRVSRLQELEEALLDYLSPKRNAAGELEWKLPPEKFESTLQALIKLVDRIELSTGGVTSRTEVKALIEVNMKVVCATFGSVLNDFVRDHAISPKTARQIVDKFKAKINTKEIVMDPNYTIGSGSPTKNDEGSEDA